MKKEDEFIVTPDSFTQEQWCEMYIKVVECAQELKIEIDRLNNIINELEKYINKNIEMTNSAITFNRDITKDKYEMLKYGRDATLFEMILDKLKELKEGNK